MSVRVRVPALFADRMDGVSTVEVPATTVTGALRAVSNRFQAIETLVFAAGGGVNPVMVVFLNDRQLGADELDAPVTAGDEIQIVPAIEGG